MKRKRKQQWKIKLIRIKWYGCFCWAPCVCVSVDIGCACALCVSIGCSAQYIFIIKGFRMKCAPSPNPGVVQTYMRIQQPKRTQPKISLFHLPAYMRSFFADRSWFSICFVVSSLWAICTSLAFAKANKNANTQIRHGTTAFTFLIFLARFDIVSGALNAHTYSPFILLTRRLFDSTRISF